MLACGLLPFGVERGAHHSPTSPARCLRTLHVSLAPCPALGRCTPFQSCPYPKARTCKEQAVARPCGPTACVSQLTKTACTYALGRAALNTCKLSRPARVMFITDGAGQELRWPTVKGVPVAVRRWRAPRGKPPCLQAPGPQFPVPTLPATVYPGRSGARRDLAPSTARR